MEEEIQFEKALERLEKIVGALEGGKLSLDDALKSYEEGVKLSRACSKKLNQAEKKIETLTRALNSAGDIVDADIEDDDGDGEKSGKKKAKKASKNPDSKSDSAFLI